LSKPDVSLIHKDLTPDLYILIIRIIINMKAEQRRRKSRQREMLYETILSGAAHPTAQDVYEHLKKDIPTLSLGNVYRNIAILLEEGRIRGEDFGGGTVRYDAGAEAHYHFVCKSCGNVGDFSMPVLTNLTETARRFTSHRIHGHTLRFHGVCASCTEAEAGPGEPKNIFPKKRRIKNGTHS
jgi:Fur family transcriptional regulator, peroxide stress response regulator